MGNPPFEDVSPLKKWWFSLAMLVYERVTASFGVPFSSFPPNLSLPRIHLQFSLTGSQDAAAFFTFAVASNFSWESKNASISSTGEAP